MWNNLIQSASETTAAIAKKAIDAADALEKQINDGTINDFDDMGSLIDADDGVQAVAKDASTTGNVKAGKETKTKNGPGNSPDDNNAAADEDEWADDAEELIFSKNEYHDDDVSPPPPSPTLEGDELISSLISKITILQKELAQREEQLSNKATQIASIEEQHALEIQHAHAGSLQLQQVIDSLMKENREKDKVAAQLRKEGDKLAERYGIVEQTLKKSRAELKAVKGELDAEMEEHIRCKRRMVQLEKDLWRHLRVGGGAGGIAPSIPPRGRAIVEMREYEIRPDGVADYVAATVDGASLRKSLTPLFLFTMPEMGGNANSAIHIYHYADGFDQRKDCRDAMVRHLGWNEYLAKVTPLLARQSCNLFWEAIFMAHVVGLERFTPGDDAPGIFEYSRYQLSFGSLTSFLSFYEKNIEEKLASVHESSSLVTLLYNDEEVIEIWRHGDAAGFLESGLFSPSFDDLRDCVVGFQRLVHRPLAFSPLI